MGIYCFWYFIVFVVPSLPFIFCKTTVQASVVSLWNSLLVNKYQCALCPSVHLKTKVWCYTVWSSVDISEKLESLPGIQNADLVAFRLVSDFLKPFFVFFLAEKVYEKKIVIEI